MLTEALKFKAFGMENNNRCITIKPLRYIKKNLEDGELMEGIQTGMLYNFHYNSYIFFLI